jgi:poly-gamma-glutamate synthase PgsB/CapB
MVGLIFGLFLLILFGVIEFHKNKIYHKHIPVIIHVNGTRGKSSVTRLIAAGLRAGGKKTIAKTTGSAPRLIFENGKETPIIRHHGANIKEQLKIIKFVAKRKIDILVLECMAVNPEYQWVTEHEIVNSNIGVITNSRLDHLDLMGPGIKNVTLSLCNTLPPKGIAFTAEKTMFPLIKKQAEKNHTELIQAHKEDVADKDMEGFSHIEHKENVALSLGICEHLGVDKEIALRGMYDALPDIGATEIFYTKYKKKDIFFAHSFAANDPESTEFLINYIKNLHPEIDEVIIVLSTRADRMFRSKQLIRMLTKMEFDRLFLIGEQTGTIRSYALRHHVPVKKIVDIGWTSGEELVEIVSKLKSEDFLMLGIGNIGGNGGIIVNYFKERK